MRKKGLVEQIVIGNPAEKDFSASDLPHNRRKLFAYMFKNKFFKIYKNHLLIALFFAPLIIFSVLMMDYTNEVFSLPPKEGIKHLLEYSVTVNVVAIPLWAVAFAGLAGGLNVIRKLAWSEPVILKMDFFGGIRKSGKQLALVGALWGAAYAIVRYAIDWLGFYHKVFDGKSVSIFGVFTCLFLLAVLFGLTVYMACMSSQYNTTFKQLLVGSFKLYFSDFFLATGVILLSLLPILVLELIGLTFTTLLCYFLELAILIGIMIIPMFLVCQHTFDRVINKKDYPTYYGKGLSYGQTSTGKSALAEDYEYDTENPSNDTVESDFERVTDDKD